MAAEGGLRVEGIVAPTEPQQIAAHVSGRVSAIGCEAGAHVEAGWLCAEIDPRPFQAAVDRSTHALKAAQARLDRESARLGAARDALQGAKGVQRRSAVARLRRSVERHERSVDRAAADVEQAQAALAASKAELSATRIVAPIDGTIRARNVAPGEEVSAESKAPMFVIAPDTARIVVKLGAAQSALIAVGDKTVFTIDALPGRSFEGEVTKIEPARAGAEASVEIMARDPGHALAPGTVGRARISPRKRTDP
nr:efflux RND transporter periplasmic adaptor subunit [Methylosinus sp. KRF6]